MDTKGIQIKYKKNTLVQQKYGINTFTKNLFNLDKEKNYNYNMVSLDQKPIVNKKLKPLTPLKRLNPKPNEIIDNTNTGNLDIFDIKNNISQIMEELKDANIYQTKSDISDIKTKIEGIKDIDISDIKDELFRMKKDIEEIKKLLFTMINNKSIY